MKELNDLDLETVAGGKNALRDTLNRANRAFDSIDQAAREGRELFKNGNNLFNPPRTSRRG